MNHPLCRKNNFLAYVEKKLQNLSTLDGFVLACLFIAIWTLYFTVTEMPVALKHDMTEAYSWGQEFQLGYHQPPLFGHGSAVYGFQFFLLIFCHLLHSALPMLRLVCGVYGTLRQNWSKTRHSALPQVCSPCLRRFIHFMLLNLMPTLFFFRCGLGFFRFALVLRSKKIKTQHIYSA
ncbi:MAG: hypothetical protein ABF537_11405 [Acetobacter sp.]